MKNLFTQRQLSTRREGVVTKLYGRLLLLAAMMMMAVSANSAIPYKIYDYDFEHLSDASKIVMSNTAYSAADGGNWSNVKVCSTVNGADGSKLAFWCGTGNEPWKENNWWWNFYGNPGLYNQDWGSPSLAILGLRAGDIVTITCTSNDALKYVKFDGNVHAVYQYSHDDFHDAWWGNTSIESGRPIHITSDGDLILRNTGTNCIKKIYIQSIKNATYEITKDTYNINGVNRPRTTFTFTGDGLMDYNDIAVPYLRVSFGDSKNYVVVDGGNSYIFRYDENEGLVTNSSHLPTEGSFYTFTPTGSGRVTLSGSYNGKVYLFKYKDGWQYDNGNLHWVNPWGWTGGDITFDVEAGYTYFLCEDKNETTNNSFRLHSFSFTNYFYLDPLAVIKESSAPNGYLTTIHGLNNVTINNSGRSYVKRHSENIDVDNLALSLNNGQLSVSGIAFVDEDANKGGTIIYHLDTSEGVADLVITIPYAADWGTDNDEYGSRSWGHMWNFADPRQSDSGRNTTGLLELGKASDSNSKLSEEIAKREWNYAQRVTGESGGFHDPMYTNVFDMEGDNADMIWETEGLWFDTESNLSCLWNENAVPTLKGDAAHYTDYSTNSDPDRYIGLLPPSEGGVSSFTIPGLKDGDRVEIFLGSGEASGTDVPYFEITGAKDALGKAITGEYGCGGSMWRPSGSNYNYRSCYQFIKNGDGNMKFALKRGSMAKLYSIRIYRGDKSYRNHVERRSNSDGYQLLNTYKDGAAGADGKTSTWTLHFRGKGEMLFNPEVLASEGTLDMSTSGLFRTNDHLYVTLKTKIGQYGTFRLRIKGSDYTGDYTTDYADQSISVGYLEKMQYPYTWDFTDLKKYVDDDYTTGISQELSQISQDNKVNIWTTDANGYGLTVQNNGVAGNVRDDQVFTSGAQLYAGADMFEETSGIGVEAGHGRAINSKMVLTSTGLIVSSNRNSEFVLRVPEVDGGAAVYVRAKKLAENGNRPYLEKCLVGSGAQQDFSKTIAVGNDATSDEYVFVVKNTSTDAQDIRVKLNNYEIKRIAVSTDPKKVNVKGYASESRNHAIDASLLPYFTGEDMMTYTVAADSETGEAVDYKNLTINMLNAGSSNAVADKSHVIPANTGCVIRRVVDETGGAVDDKTFDVLTSGDGFHLFVPDMHDTENLVNPSFNNQFLVAAVEGMEQGVPYSNTGGFVKFDHSYDTTGAAIWYAYTWKDGENGSWVGETNGMYVGLKDYVIFVRLNPNPQAINGTVYPNPDFHNAWNKTNTLTVQKDKQFTMTGYDSNNKLENYGQYIDQVVGSWGDLPTPAVDMTNYVLTYKYKKVNPDGTLSGTISGEEKFYRVHSNWNIKLRANSAYLQLPTASVSPSGDATNAPNRAPSFRFKFDNNDYMRGDVNADQTVDVADFVATANYILGNEPESFVFKAGDLNKDADIDVSDFISVANIILGRPAQSHAMSRGANADMADDALYVEPFEAVPGTQQVISVRMSNSMPVAGYEFNLRLPEGITVARNADGLMAELSTERTNERRTNFFGTALQADGTLKVLCGTSNADDSGLYTFYGDEGEVARITVNIPENYKQGMCTAAVTDARYTDQEGQLYFFGTTTGISVIAAEAVSESDTYYTLSGQKLDGRPSQRGFYIVNGKKVLVK